MSTLSQFISDLASNPTLQQDYLNDPAATMQKYGLQSHEVEAVLTADKAKVEQLSGKTTHAVTFFFPVK
ncbi:hypothetical protein [Arsukibacterium indicum]|uniref:Extradiol ring-cleavage dioxygenase LigAB LigA subunit domain-containing protein n=1 Tax=Arsukibacterium indicum TaxID=2848612 RepID=A0ABS6MNP2_9GAMM|nr:hypothetical protein [Arsukibacterium indicum]MBV2130430.1 hypothetical protein [Arsukibacterium indicum]